jgi:hypothetical protein
MFWSATVWVAKVSTVIDPSTEDAAVTAKA